jgi:tight adherence protein B
LGILLLGPAAILIVTFALVMVATRRSPDQKFMDQRIILIQSVTRDGSGIPSEAAQLLKATRTGNFASFEDLLSRLAIVQRLQKRIMQADSRTSVTALLLRSVGLSLVSYSLAWLIAPMALIDSAVAAALGFLPYGMLSFKRSRRINAFNACLAETIDMLARALRAGYSMIGAIEMLAGSAPEPAASEFGEIFKQQNLGMPLREALLQLLDRVPSLDLSVLVTAILVQKDTGGNLVEILDRTVFIIRERLRIQGDIRAHTAEGRLTGWILSALPVVMLAIINLLNPGYSSVFLHDPLGRKMIYVSIGMLVVGSLIIRRIINGIEV